MPESVTITTEPAATPAAVVARAPDAAANASVEASPQTTVIQHSTDTEIIVKDPSLWSKAVNIIAYPLGGWLGYYVFDTWTRKSMYANFAKRKFFADLQVPDTNALKKITQEATINKAVNVADHIPAIHDNYLQAVKSRVVNEWNMKGIGDYWRCLHRNQKIETIVFSATAAGVTIGTLLSISDHLGNVKDIIFRKENKVPPAPSDPSPQR